MPSIHTISPLFPKMDFNSSIFDKIERQNSIVRNEFMITDLKMYLNLKLIYLTFKIRLKYRSEMFFVKVCSAVSTQKKTAAIVLF